jgi:hypothetical protein
VEAGSLADRSPFFAVFETRLSHLSGLARPPRTKDQDLRLRARSTDPKEAQVFNWSRWLLVMSGVLALGWYGYTGETGPMGWLNSWQVGHDGTYSRGLSFGILCLALAAIMTSAIRLRAMLGGRTRERKPGLTAEQSAAAGAFAHALVRSGWPTALLTWLVGVAIAWGGVLAWHGWVLQRRLDDANSRYPTLRIDHVTAAERPADGSHLGLQGRLLWDHALVRRQTDGGGEPEIVFVPVAASDWRDGDAVTFVAQLDREQADALRARIERADAPLLVRVMGTLPTATRPVFEKSGVPVAGTAVAVDVIESQDGRVTARPTLAWANVVPLGMGLTALWTFGFGALAFALEVEARKRQERPGPTR